MKNYISIILIFTFFWLNAQKTEEKTITNNAIQYITIEGDAFFKIDVKTTTNKTIKINSRTEGEDALDTIILKEIKNDSLIISSIYKPLVKNYNDKLSVHKVTSIELLLEIPENLNLYFKSKIGSAKIYGRYKTLFLELHQGNANIFNFLGNAIINTFNGDINLETANATVKAKSKTGSVNYNKITSGKNQVQINTINGNINIHKTKK